MEYPEKITGFRSKVINGIIEAGKASRPVAGNGIHVSGTSAGSSISLEPGFSAARPFPFVARLVRAMKDGETVAAIQVWLGRVLLSGGAVAEFDAEGSELEPRNDSVSGLSCVEIPAEGVSAVWINAYPDDDPPRYTLGTSADGGAAASLKVAEIAAGGNVIQRLAGDVALPAPALPWAVGATPRGDGTFGLTMDDGHMFCWSLGSDHAVRLPATLATVSGAGFLYVEFSVAPAGSFPAVSLAYAATVPASRDDTVRVPVAQVLAGGRVLQYLCGTLFFHLVQDEEV